MKQLGEVYNPAKHACCREKIRITNPFFLLFFYNGVALCVSPPGR